jgi:hypothetical protein
MIGDVVALQTGSKSATHKNNTSCFFITMFPTNLGGDKLLGELKLGEDHIK